MGLVRHLDGYRRIWMFPRNIRNIYPWKMAQILTHLLQKEGSRDWTDQKNQQDFCKDLEKAGLKKQGFQYDPNSGGPRTYVSQLRCLGLVFVRKKELFSTLAGEDLVAGKHPLPIMQKVLLRHQYPSAYSSGPNVRIHPSVQVKPFLFILQLLNDSEIGSLSQEELCVPLMYGHNQECMQLCKEKILKLRTGKSLIDVIDNPAEDLYTPRTDSSDVEKRINEIDGNIANSCKNYLKSCCLIAEEEINGINRIYFNEDIRELYESELAETDRFIDFTSEEAFQRRYGAWDRSKDTRPLTRSEPVYPGNFGKCIVMASFFEYCGQEFVSDMPEEFVLKMVSGYGFSASQVRDFIEPRLPSAIDYFESTFIESSTGGASGAKRFEDGLTALLEKKLGFFTRYTGQLARKGVGAFADVFVAADGFGNCAVIDAKATRKYSLNSGDYSKMVSNYIPNYKELTERFGETRGRNVKLAFAAFAGGGFIGTIGGKLSEIRRETGVPCSAVRARDLLSLAKTGVSKEKFWEGMSKGKLLSISDFY